MLCVYRLLNSTGKDTMLSAIIIEVGWTLDMPELTPLLRMFTHSFLYERN